MKPFKQRAKKTKGFKSRFEELFASNMARNGIECEYEKLKIKYFKEHVYKLDFSLNSDTMLIETKGYFKAEDRQKLLDVKKNNPELDIRLVFMADQKLHKLSKTRYSDWCIKHGFKYTVSKEGNLPNDWLKELKKDNDIKKPTTRKTKGKNN